MNLKSKINFEYNSVEEAGMQDKNENYAVLDQPRVVNRLFHPRPLMGQRPAHPGRRDMMIPVNDNVMIGASLHLARATSPCLLFFHGNGEIVADYDDLGGLFAREGLNFFVADYRGYGQSTGQPTVSSMMKDCHEIADFILAFMAENKMTGPLCIMGRSLGSASAIELASRRDSQFKCLIVESGFAFASPLLRILGIDPEALGFKEEQGFENIDKIKLFSKPCLVIHAQHDHIIPFSDGQALYDACPSPNKRLLEIKGANHNDIFLKGMTPYLSHVKAVCCQ